MRNSTSYALAIFVAGFLLAGAVLVFFGIDQQVLAQNLSCQNLIITFNWDSGGVACTNVSILVNGATIASGLSCQGNYNWTGAAHSTTYTYEIRTSGGLTLGQGTFTTSPDPGALCGTLSVSLTATPPSGTAPLTTSLEALESGSAVGSRNFSFWWNCSNTTTSVSAASAACGALPSDTTPTRDGCTQNANGAKCDGETESRRAIFHTYATAGPYTAKVIAEKGSAPPAQAQQTIPVTASLPDLVPVSPISVSGSLVPGGSVGFVGTIRNTVSGSSAGGSIAQLRIYNSGGTMLYDNDQGINPLAGGTSQSTSFDSWSPPTAGTYTLELTADNGSNVSESNEGNNVLSQPLTVSTAATQCSDLVDNDGDGSVDFGPDPGCSSPSDDDERNACTDGVDNDGDGVIDHSSVNPPGGPLGNPDPGCSSPQDNSEANPPIFCEVNPDDPNATCP